MSRLAVALLLVLAACLEVGGDAIVRFGLKSCAGPFQAAVIVLGGVVLLSYGLFVNFAPLDFGRLLGIYVAVFFVVAQLTNLLAFAVRPSLATFVGGALIVGGGIVLTLWNR